MWRVLIDSTVVCILCDWSEWLLWFWFYDTHYSGILLQIQSQPGAVFTKQVRSTESTWWCSALPSRLPGHSGAVTHLLTYFSPFLLDCWILCNCCDWLKWSFHFSFNNEGLQAWCTAYLTYRKTCSPIQCCIIHPYSQKVTKLHVEVIKNVC